MNLREFIQSEIKSHLTDYKSQVVSENLDKYSKDAITDMIVNLSRYEGNEDLIADLKKILKNRSLGKPKRDESVKEVKGGKKVTKKMWDKMDSDEREEVLLTFFKDPDDVQNYIDSKWNDLPNGAANGLFIFESVNEAKFTDYDNNELAAYLKNNPKDKEAAKELSKRSKKLRDLSRTDESVNEEQLDEKLITFSNRAPYGQIVFMAGGAGSGKGFAIDNFIDAAGFKVRDVDEMKKAVGKLDQLGKFSIDKWFDKYSNKLKPDERAHVEEFVVGKGMTISDVASNLKNPNNVAALHYIVDSMGLKDKWLINMLSGKTNKETLPNLLFDITAKKVSSITEVIKPLINAGYDSKNIHLIWVLTNYHLAVSQNKSRERVVPDDILLNTHEGAAKTIWSILTSSIPKGLNGRIDVILNNRENTLYWIKPSLRKSDDDGKKFGMSKDLKGDTKKVGIISGFLSLPIKKQGGGIVPEKLWKTKLFSWIKDNAPKTLNLSQTTKE